MMEMITKLFSFLSGYKTYVMAIAYGIDSVGAQLGWWEPDVFRTRAEEVLTIIFLRMGVTKSGPSA